MTAACTHQIEYLSLNEIQPDPRNPRSHKARHIKLLAKSIDEFGFNVPVLIDDAQILVAGHGRWEAAKLLGLDTIPAIRIVHLTEQQRRAFMVADNRLHDLSSWNRENLGSILLELADAELDFDIELTGYSVGEIDLMLSLNDDEDQDSDEQMPKLGPAISKAGDLFLLGEHRLLCGNTLDPANWVNLMQGEVANLVVTDPPYNVPIDGHVCGAGKIKHREFAMASGEMDEAGFTAFLEQAMRHACAYSADGILHYWAMDWRHLQELTAAARRNGLEQVNLCVWVKTAGMGSFYRSQHELFGVYRHGKGRPRNNVQLGIFGRNRTNVWNYPGVNHPGHGGEEGKLLALHPTVKPVALLADAILDSTERGALVVDPFLGSGSTLIAAEKVSRRCFGLELDPLYCDTIIRRWQNWSGQKAVRALDGVLFDTLEQNYVETADE